MDETASRRRRRLGPRSADTPRRERNSRTGGGGRRRADSTVSGPHVARAETAPTMNAGEA